MSLPSTASTRPCGRLGRFLAVAGMAGAMLVGCAPSDYQHDPYFDPELSVREAPMVAGNTYDRQNALAIIYPAAERINISYEYELDGEVSIDAPGYFSGPGWIYYDRQPALPYRFVILHLTKAEEGYDVPRGETLRLGQRRFFALDYCVSGWDRGEGDPELVPYLQTLADNGHELSRDIYIRRFIPRNADSSGRRTNIIMVRDITRDGYTCDRLGDIRKPEGDSLAETIKGFKEDAAGSFEIMG